MLFPDGIVYNRQKDKVQTSKINSVMELARCLSVSLSKNKKGQKADFANLSPLVTPMIQSSNFLLRELEELKNLTDYLKAA